MKNLKYILIITPLIMAVIFLFLFIKTSDELNQVKTEYEKSIASLEKEKSELIQEIKNFKTPVDIEKSEMSNNLLLSRWFVEKLKDKGLANPVRDIISDLADHRELIPYEGVLGGTMRFYEGYTWVLNEKWAFAYFEDGHISGYLLLEYEVENNGKINWKRIAAMLS
jgi:hypothetical protein